MQPAKNPQKAVDRHSRFRRQILQLQRLEEVSFHMGAVSANRRIFSSLSPPCLWPSRTSSTINSSKRARASGIRPGRFVFSYSTSLSTSRSASTKPGADKPRRVGEKLLPLTQLHRAMLLLPPVERRLADVHVAADGLRRLPLFYPAQHCNDLLRCVLLSVGHFWVSFPLPKRLIRIGPVVLRPVSR